MAYATNSSGNYSGTIVISPVRPANPNSTIATGLSNEIRGGHHTYETIIERDAIIESRRDWGMLCTIYNDSTPSNNKTYILKYGFTSTNLLDNSNWVEFVTTGASFVPTGGEWINSVQVVSATPSVLTDGYRYLVDTGGIGDFFGQDGKIAQYNSTALTFSFVEPTDGTTLRVDSDPNTIYKYQGTFSTGIWVKEFLNQVRYLSATSSTGLTYSATSLQTPLTDYSNSIYYVSFNMTSSGTVSLSIDSLPFIDVKQLGNNVISSIGSGEIIPGIQYQLIYNSGNLQTVLPSSSTTTIGQAEDGNYTDGFFTDFIPSTPIGTAVDRINELLSFLVPPTSPTFSSLSATGSFVNGGVSFDNTTSGFFGVTGSPYGSVLKGGQFTNVGFPYRLGIMSKVLQPVTGDTYYKDISGIFNIHVANSNIFSTYSFGDGLTGTVSLILNGTTVSSIGLTSGLASDTTSSGATSGINLSAAGQFVRSIYGNTFPYYYGRTASYLIKRDSGLIREGYNYFVAKHDFATYSNIVNQWEFVADSSTQSITPTVRIVSSVNSSSVVKWLSGIKYWFDPMNFKYEVTLSNVLSNTFNASSNAITYRDVSYTLSSTNNVTNTISYNGFDSLTGTTNSIFRPTLTNTSIVFPTGGTPSTNLSISMTFSVASRKRRLNQEIGFAMDVLKTIQGTFSGATSLGTSVPLSNWFIDTFPPESSDTEEVFTDEVYRKLNGSSKYNSYTASYGISLYSGTWSSTASLLNDSQHNNGLQVVNGMLVYPSFTFSAFGTSVTNPNFGLTSSTNYSNCFTVFSGFGTSSTSSPTNYRTYTRRFQKGITTPTWQIFITTIGSLSLIAADRPLTGNSVWIEAKIPGVTPWLDLGKSYATPFVNGSGCSSIGGLLALSGSTYNSIFNFGTYSNNGIFVRITTSSGFSTKITKIICQNFP
jgi:hypothetical protein